MCTLAPAPVRWSSSQLHAPHPALQRNSNTPTALMVAAIKGHTAIVEALLSAGAEIDHQNNVSVAVPSPYPSAMEHVHSRPRPMVLLPTSRPAPRPAARLHGLDIGWYKGSHGDRGGAAQRGCQVRDPWGAFVIWLLSSDCNA